MSGMHFSIVQRAGETHCQQRKVGMVEECEERGLAPNRQAQLQMGHM